MKQYSAEYLTNLIIDARVLTAKLLIENDYLEAIDRLFADTTEDEIPKNLLDDLRWGTLHLENEIEKKSFEIASIIMRDQVKGFPGSRAFSNLHSMIASDTELLKAFEIAREEIKEDVQREEMIAIWLEDCAEDERLRQEEEKHFEETRAMAETLLSSELWTELGLPSPENLVEQLKSGAHVELRGQTFSYSSGMIWVTNAYGEDSCFSGKPDIETAKDLLISAVRDEEYGPVPY